LDNARDADRYASAEFQFIGVDELTQFSEKQYLDLFARLRAPACLRCEFENLLLLHRSEVRIQHADGCATCADLKRQRRRVDSSKFPHLAAAHIPLRMRSASNPGGVAHTWVRQRLVIRKGRYLATACLFRLDLTTILS